MEISRLGIVQLTCIRKTLFEGGQKHFNTARLFDISFEGTKTEEFFKSFSKVMNIMAAKKQGLLKENTSCNKLSQIVEYGKARRAMFG